MFTLQLHICDIKIFQYCIFDKYIPEYGLRRPQHVEGSFLVDWINSVELPYCMKNG
jgi:hypothetical protein